MEIGEDPARPGLADTPARFARWWLEFVDYDPGNLATTFPVSEMDQMVVVGPIRVWSVCEHHLLPFYCDVTVGYVTDERVLGLSKLARIAHQHAHSLQIQERLVEQVADSVVELSGSADVAVLGRGEHLCMSMRGIRSPAIMTTSVMRGSFRESVTARAEFLSLAGPQSPTA